MKNTKSEYVPKGEVVHILAALTPPNRLACEVSLATGLRINDVLSLKTEKVAKGRFTVREEKTGKTKSVRLPEELRKQCLSIAGQHFVFEGRLNGKKHRTRQAVFKDLRRVAKLYGCKPHLSPHSMRKIYAVEQYAKYGDLKRVQSLLNHSDESVTLLYALADSLDRRKNPRTPKKSKITKSRKK